MPRPTACERALGIIERISQAPELRAPTSSHQSDRLLHLSEHVLVLHVPDDERPLSLALSDDELTVVEARVDGDHLDGAVVVLARRDGGPRLAEVEDGPLAVVDDGEIAE